MNNFQKKKKKRTKGQKNYPECLSSLSLLPCLLNLRPPHLFIVLPFSDSTIILKSKKNIKTGQLAQLRIGTPFFRIDNAFIGFTPSGKNVNIQFFKEADYFRDSSSARSSSFVLENRSDETLFFFRLRMRRTTSRSLSSVTYSSKISLRSDSILACCQIGCCEKSLSAVRNVE